MTDTAKRTYWNPEIQRVVDRMEAGGWECIRCGHEHDTRAGYVLTVHHADNDKANAAWWNLLALCQRCHLRVQATVDMSRPWVMLPHSAWFAPYVAGFYAHKYLAADLTRPEVEANLDFLLGVERAVFRGDANPNTPSLMRDSFRL